MKEICCFCGYDIPDGARNPEPLYTQEYDCCKECDMYIVHDIRWYSYQGGLIEDIMCLINNQIEDIKIWKQGNKNDL